MPKISLIIPVYNVEKYLPQCLDSCVNQTFSDIEIICVDDCSPDNSSSILAEYAKHDSRIKVISHSINKHLGGARNTGVQNASGDYIWFIDSDDWISLTACEQINNAITGNNPDVIVIGIKTFDDKTGKAAVFFVPSVDKGCQLDSHTEIMNFALNYEVLAAWSKIIRRYFYLDHFIFLENITAEDIPTFILFVYSKCLVIINDCLYYYRINRDGSIIFDSGFSFKKGVVQNIKYLYELVDQSPVEKYEKKLIKNLVAKKFLSWHFDILFSCSLAADKNVVYYIFYIINILRNISYTDFFDIKRECFQNKILFIVINKLPLVCSLLILLLLCEFLYFSISAFRLSKRIVKRCLDSIEFFKKNR